MTQHLRHRDARLTVSNAGGQRRGEGVESLVVLRGHDVSTAGLAGNEGQVRGHGAGSCPDSYVVHSHPVLFRVLHLDDNTLSYSVLSSFV